MDDGIHSTGLDCFLALSNAIGIAAAPLEMEQVNLWFIKYAYVAILHLAQLLLDHTLQCNPQTAGLVCDLLYIQRNVTKVTWDIKYLQLVRRDFCHHSSVKKKKKKEIHKFPHYLTVKHFADLLHQGCVCVWFNHI